MNPAGGTVAAKGLTVSAKEPANMEVKVEGGNPNGQIWIPGTSLANQGMYFASNDSTTALAIGAASEANPRIDTVVARIKDSFYAGAANEFLLEVIPGTPTGGLVKAPKTKAEAEADKAGAVPASSLVLAYILVPKSAASIVAGNIENVVAQVEPPAEWVTKALARSAGLNYRGVTAKGFTNIATEQSRENAAFGTLTTPDEVTVELQENGLIVVGYQAIWKRSASLSTVEATIALNGIQVKRAEADGTAAGVLAELNGTENIFVPLSSNSGGLNTVNPDSGYTGNSTTGQLLGIGTTGGKCAIFAAAGTYKVSIQFRSTSGTVTVKNRQLWVKAEAYS